MSRALTLVAALLLLLLAAPARAHKSSDAYLFLDARADGTTTLRWDIALRDLDAALPIDADEDRRLTWAEIKAAWPAIDALALGALTLPGCSLQVTGHALERRNDGAYAVLQMASPCRLKDAATPDGLSYRLFADVDPTHRGILRFTDAQGQVSVHLLDPTRPQPAAAGDVDPLPGQGASAQPAQAAAAAPGQPSFLREGIHHIVTGYDHLLFLFCLLLPAVVRREGGRWQAVQDWRSALWPVVRTVTLFTLAHTLTLGLAATGRVSLPAGIVEPAIALTIMIAAFDNLRPVIGRYRGWVTFGFGLIHGFGFAGVLGELDLPAAQFGWALLQFNLGLELGQLAMVLLAVPLLYLARGWRLYGPGVIGAGSAAALLVALGWLLDRTAFEGLMPF